MITGEIKNKVDKIWTDIWSSGLTNPMYVIEQITYLMFIRSLDEKELEQEFMDNTMGTKGHRIFPSSAVGQSMRWSKFKDKAPAEIYKIIQEYVFPAIREMKNGRLPDFDDEGKIIPILDESLGEGENYFAKYMQKASFEINTPGDLDKVIKGLDSLYENDIQDLDMQGDLYEYMLGKVTSAGINGQFRTPKHIREMMVKLIKPTPDDVICDPACGTAGFLVSAAEYLRANYEDDMTGEQWEKFATTTFSGFDTDTTMLRISAMNLMLHSITNPEVKYQDSVSDKNTTRDKYTVCLANPPFAGNIAEENISGDLKAIVDTSKTELLFLALFLRILQNGGRCACIVPNGVVANTNKAYKQIRKTLVDEHLLRGVISMPSGVFNPYSGVSTSILIFTKTGDGGTDKVWFYDMKSDGYSLDTKREFLGNGDIEDIIQRFENLDAEAERDCSEQSFLVPVEEIRKNNYELLLTKYKKVEYVPEEYPPVEELMADLAEIEMRYGEGMEKLQEMLGL